jgi:hypothetical protein
MRLAATRGSTGMSRAQMMSAAKPVFTAARSSSRESLEILLSDDFTQVESANEYARTLVVVRGANGRQTRHIPVCPQHS